MRKKHLLTFITLSALLFMPNIGKADVLFSESFDARATGQLSTGAWSSGTLASDGNWYTNGSPSVFHQVAADAQLSYSGYCSTAIGKAVTTSGNNQKDYTLFAAGKQKTSLSAGEKYYLSFLFKATTLNTSDQAIAGTNNTAHIAGLLTVANNSALAATQNVVAVKTKTGGSKYYLGVRKKNETMVFGTTELSLNTTYLVIAEYCVVSGSQNDVVNLYINPNKDTPVAEVSTSDQSYASTYADATGFVGVGILGGAHSPTGAVIDEIKVTTSWSDLWEAGEDPDPDPEPEVVPAPSPASSDVTSNSATISWAAVEGADSYVLQWKANGGSYSSDIAINKDVRSYSMSGLSANTQYYVRVKTIKGESASAWTEINFTTLLPSLAPEASNITVSTAKISWPAISGITVDSYTLQWKEGDGSWSEEINNGTSRIYNMSGLNSETTFSVRVKAKKGTNYSDWSEISFTTNAYTDPIVYKGITFDKWESTSALPTAGEYYLANNIEHGFTDITLSGDLKLCLNGRTFTTRARIIVPDGVTLTIYDNEGDGSISGYYECGAYPLSGLIHIEDGGTLILHEGAVQNLDVDPNDGYLAYAIYSQGNLHIAGNPVISAATADIRLFSGKVITLDGELTNTTKYSVNPAGQTITSGWSTYMSGEDPYMYFVSVKSGYKGIILSEGEARFVPLSELDLNLSESSEDNESKLTAQLNENASLAITRSPLTNAQYNTICLPYSMDDDEMQLRFGEDYDLEEFVSSSIDGDVLNLTFNQVTSLVAGKPYLLKPSIDAPVLAYASVNIEAASPVDQEDDTYISFHGTFNPTELEGGNRNLLFLGADNELFWPAADGNIKGFRAYFEVKGAAQKAAKRARIVKKEEGATGIDQITNDKLPMTNKILKDGQLLIRRDNKTYNVLGMEYGNGK